MSVHESDEENRRQKNAALVHEMHFYIGAPAGISPELRTPLVVKDEPDTEALTVGAKVGFLKFQKGPLAEVDRNGIMLEELLPELIRLVDGYNQVVPCRETALVKTKLEEALMWQRRRTELRKAQGVEGTFRQHKS